MTNPDPTLRTRANQDEILEAFARRLEELGLGNQATVIVSDQAVPDSTAFASGKILIVVSPGPGQFPQELWNGAGASTATEDGSVVVSIYVRNVADKAGSRWSMLIGSPKAKRPTAPTLTGLKRIVLKNLLVSSEPTITGSLKAWEPTADDGRPLLRDTPLPVRATGPLDVPGMQGWVGIQITISCTWDWDLYA